MNIFHVLRGDNRKMKAQDDEENEKISFQAVLHCLVNKKCLLTGSDICQETIAISLCHQSGLPFVNR